MTRTERGFDLASLLLLAGVVAYTMSVYGALPARMAIHFDLHGAPNGWMDRPYATWGVDALALLVWSATRSLPSWLPAKSGWRERARRSPMAALAFLSALLLGGVAVFVVQTGLHPESSRGPALSLFLGIYALGYSVVVPRLRRNPLIGVRTAWSLTSDENWARVHRLASYTFAAGGVACLGLGLAGFPAVGIVLAIAASVAPWAYSWTLAYRLPPES